MAAAFEIGPGARRVVGLYHPGQGLGVEAQDDAVLLALLGLLRDLDRADLAAPRAVGLLDERIHLIGREIADHEEGGVARHVPALEEGQAVRLVLLGHALDVLEKAHRGVAVGALAEGGLVQGLVEHEVRVGDVLVVLAEHRLGLGLEGGLRVLEVLEAIGLEGDDRRERLGRAVGDEEREVVGGLGVAVHPGGLEHGPVLLARVSVGAAEHHVLEEVREAGAPVLDLVARAHAHQGVVGDEAPGASGQENDLEAVLEGPHVEGRRQHAGWDRGLLCDPAVDWRRGHSDRPADRGARSCGGRGRLCLAEHRSERQQLDHGLDPPVGDFRSAASRGRPPHWS